MGILTNINIPEIRQRMATNGVTHHEERLLRLTYFLIKPCTSVLQKLLEKLSVEKLKKSDGDTYQDILKQAHVRSALAKLADPGPRALSKDQWRTLYGNDYPFVDIADSKPLEDYDISLLVCLLRQKALCGLTRPSNGWDQKPPEMELKSCLEANIAIIKYHRNMLTHTPPSLMHKHICNKTFDELKDAVNYIQRTLSGSPLYNEKELEEMRTVSIITDVADEIIEAIESAKRIKIPECSAPNTPILDEDKFVGDVLEVVKRHCQLSKESIENNPRVKGVLSWLFPVKRGSISAGCLVMTVYCTADKDIPEEGEEIEWMSEIMTNTFKTDKMKDVERRYNRPDDIYVKVIVKKCELVPASSVVMEEDVRLIGDDSPQANTQDVAGELNQPTQVKAVTVIADFVLRSDEERRKEYLRQVPVTEEQDQEERISDENSDEMTTQVQLLRMEIHGNQKGLNEDLIDTMAEGPLPITRSPKERIAGQSEVVTHEESLLQTLRLPVEEIASNDSKFIRKFDLLTIDKPLNDVPEKVVLVVGPTGSGKTTLINAIANYVLGVEFEDDKRFILVPKEHKASLTESQTEGITSYTMHHQEGFRIPFTLTLIDTPGYGDTRGLDWDKKNTENIKEFFSCKGKPYAIDSISAILFVVQSGNNRLGAAEKYTYESILELFGKDTASNIFPIFTFCDDSEPKALNATKEIGIPCPKFFKINNIIVDEIKNKNPRRQPVQIIKWEDWREVLEELMEFVSSTEEKSLILTNEVLLERERLYCKIAGLKDDILKQVALLAELKVAKETHLLHESDLANANRKYYTLIMQVGVKEYNVPGCYSFICKLCKRNCHRSCRVPVTILGRLCCVIKKDKCTVCNCGTAEHSVALYHYKVSYQEKKPLISEIETDKIEIKRKSRASLHAVETTTTQCAELQNKVYEMVVEISQIMRTLNEKALRPKAISEKDYIDLLIRQQEQGQQVGWEGRVEQLRVFQDEAAFSNYVAESLTGTVSTKL